MPGGYTSFYRPPTTPTGNPSLPGLATPTPTPSLAAPVTLPPPPTIPTIPQPPSSQFLPLLQQLIGGFSNVQPFQKLGPEVSALIEKFRTSALAQLDQYASRSQGSLLGRLFGRNMQMSSNAIDRTNELSSDIGLKAGMIENATAQQILDAMKYSGGFDLSKLGQQGSLLLGGAGAENSQYNSLVNAILGQGSLANQIYGTQTSGILGLGGLQQNEQQMIFDLLTRLISMNSSTALSSGGTSGSGGVSRSLTPTSPIGGQTEIDQLISLLMRFLGG